MADLALSFDEELIRAGAGIYCMAGEANIHTAGRSVGGICWAWNHSTVQEVVPIYQDLMVYRRRAQHNLLWLAGVLMSPEPRNSMTVPAQ
jgi:hypothetical protein